MGGKAMSNQLEEHPGFITCRFQHHTGAIEFNANALAEDGTPIAEFPYCHFKTVIFETRLERKVSTPIASKTPLHCPCKRLPVFRSRRQFRPHCSAEIGTSALPHPSRQTASFRFPLKDYASKLTDLRSPHWRSIGKFLKPPLHSAFWSVR
jgi:hypothetical protein